MGTPREGGKNDVQPSMRGGAKKGHRGNSNGSS
jgi:hypothetical protein